MTKNILVLTGSPRIGGNSDIMADAFIRGTKAAGHKVNKFEAGIRVAVAVRSNIGAMKMDYRTHFWIIYSTMNRFIYWKKVL